MLEPIAWMIDKAKHSADLGRMVAYAATGGRTGITEAADFKVAATATASTSVAVAPGGATLKNLYPNVLAQSYIIRNVSETLVEVPANNTAAPITRWVIAYIADPQFNGPAPASVENGPYVFLTTVTSIANLQYPHIVLASIVIPANTSAITNAMITDLRKMTTPRVERRLITLYPTGVRTGGLAIPTAAYGAWPLAAGSRPNLEVPTWATQLDIVGQFSGIWYTSANANDSVAGIRAGLGSSVAENGIIIENVNGARAHYSVMGKHAIPANLRGTTQPLNLQAQRTVGTGMWYADYQSSIAIDYQFTEVPV